jgi:hypothetical protein
MKSRKTLPKILVVVVCLVSSTAIAQNGKLPGGAPNPQTTPIGSTVRGRATFEDTNEPATRERIQLIPGEAVGQSAGRVAIPTAFTDDSGQFELKVVAAGEYYILARPIDEHATSNKLYPFLHPTGDVAADAIRVEEFKKKSTKIIVDGQNSLTLDLHVWNPHYGRISGHVFDADGKPATHSSVHLTCRDKQSAACLGSSTASNEAGEYTFRGLAAGDYIIGASPPLKVTSPPRIDGERPRVDLQGLSEATTYYPSTLQIQQSAPVSVLADRETSDIDIKLVARALYSISGLVRRRNGDPVTAARLHLVKKDLPMLSGNGFPEVSFTSSDARGDWSFSNVPDGTYQVVVQPSNARDDASAPFVASEQAVVIAGADVSGITLEVSSGMRISGTIVIEGESVPASIAVMAHRLRSQAQSSANVEPVSRTNKFQIVGAPDGPIELTPIFRPTERFYVKSIEAGGRDLLSEQLEGGEGDEIKDVHVVISAEVGTLSGRVVSVSGSAVNDVLVALIPRLPKQRRAIGAQPSGRTDKSGNFSLSAAPGEYEIRVFRVPQNLQPGVPQPSPVLTHDTGPVTLRPGERKTLTITVH